MSEHLAAAVQKLGAPEELVERSARARAEAQGASVDDILAAWAVHDQHHIAQVCKSIARQSTADTGAFREYLGILNDPA